MSYNSIFGLGSHLPDANLAGHWLLQENAANNAVTDRSGNGNNGTLTSGNTEDYDVVGPKVGGYLPSGLSFPASGVSIPDAVSLDVTSEFTLLGWNNRSSGEPQLLAKYVTTGNQRSFQLFSGFASIKLISSSDGTLGTLATVDIAVSSLSTNTWGHFASSLSGGSATAYRNGTAGTPAAQQNIFVSTAPLVIGSAAVRLADVAIFSRGLSETEINEHKDGPEPLNTTLPTLSITSSSWTGTIGTWDSQSNGTLTYVWELRLASDDSVVESGSGSSPSGSGSYSGGYYLWVRASNDGGYDTAEDSVSATETVGGGTPSGSATITAIGTLSGVGTSTRSGSGSISAIGTLAGVGVSARSGAGSINAIGTLSGVGEAPAVGAVSGSGTITAIAALSGVGVSVRSGTGSIDAIGTLAGVGSAPAVGGVSGSGAILAIATLAGVGTSTRSGSGNMSAIGAMVAAGTTTRSGAASVSAVATLAGVGSNTGETQSPAFLYYYMHLAN